MSRCACSIRFPAEDSRPGPAFSPPRPTSGASITACTTSCSSPTMRSPSPAAATSAMNISRAIKHSNFIDLDVVAAGAIVPQLSASFDAFWNSKYAYPIASVASPVERGAGRRRRCSKRESAGNANWLEQRTRCGTRAADLGAGHGARGSARQDRERDLSRRRGHDRQRHHDADALGANRN